MAEEVRASQTGPDGERLELRIGTRTIGLQVKELLPILLLLILGLGGYALWIATDHRLSRLLHQHEQLIETLQFQTQTFTTAIHEQRAFVLAQVQESREALRAQTQEFRRLLLALEHNIDRPPGERLPLELGPEVLPPPRH